MAKIKFIDYNSVYKKELDLWSDIEAQQGLSGFSKFVATPDNKLGEFVDYFANGLDFVTKLAFDENNLVGFVLFSIDGDVAHVEIMGTNPNFRGKGYARQIMLALKHELQKIDIDKVVFEVNKNNIPAIRSFSKIAKPNQKYSTTNYDGMELE